jgi:hypothetical protein
VVIEVGGAERFEQPEDDSRAAVTITLSPAALASATSSTAVIPQSTVRTRLHCSRARRASVSRETP